MTLTDRAAFGFVRVAAASPALQVADCQANVESILTMLEQAEQRGVAVLVFPELCLTGQTNAAHKILDTLASTI